MNEPAPAPGAPALALRAVSAAYGPFRALFGVDLEVPAGGAVAVLGPNGAGKSTVVRVASGLLAPTSGTVEVAGRPVTGHPAWRMARLGVAHVPEGRGVFGSLSVEENLVLALRRRGDPRRVGERVKRAYSRFGVLAERRRQPAGTLSGGQQRLLSLAAVIEAAPAVLLADELSLGLAPAVADDIYGALHALNGAGTALVVVEQQVERALALADRAVVLDRGTVVHAGAPGAARRALEEVLSARRARRRDAADAHGRPAR